jgi:hypothetical protein
LAGQLRWSDRIRSGHWNNHTTYKYFGAAFLLLEDQYKSLGYAGPPTGEPKNQEEAMHWHDRMPLEWWVSSSIPYEWWGRGTGPEPTQVTLPLAVPARLLRARLSDSGSFEFKDIPQGRHTIFVRWGINPDPQNNISGPFAVVVEKRGRIEQEIPVNVFDIIDT